MPPRTAPKENHIRVILDDLMRLRIDNTYTDGLVFLFVEDKRIDDRE